MLSNYQNNERSLIQTFLLVSPNSAHPAKPDMQQLRQRVVASYHLGPIDADETAAISNTAYVPSLAGNPSFDAEPLPRCTALPAASAPHQHHLRRLLLFGFLEEKTHFGEAEVDEVIADLKNEVAHQISMCHRHQWRRAPGRHAAQ